MSAPRDPAAIDALLERATAALDEDRPDEALARAEEALAVAPRSIPALHYRALALEELGRTAEARIAYEHALRAGKDDPELVLGAARFLVDGLPEEEQERVDLEEGLARARRGSRLAARAGDAGLATELHLIEGRALSLLGRPEEALSSIARAEQLAPRDAEVLREKGLALLELCRFDEAGSALAAAEAEGPEDPWTAHALGLLAERRGDAEEARRWFGRARKLAPDEFPAPDLALARHLRGRGGGRAGRAARAGPPLPRERRHHGRGPAGGRQSPGRRPAALARHPGTLPRRALWPEGVHGSLEPLPLLHRALPAEPGALRPEPRRADPRIGVTLVHEVGHFLGLDEDELYQRGLE